MLYPCPPPNGSGPRWTGSPPGGTALQSEYRKAQREEREYDTLRQNVEALLEKPREAEPQRQRNHELE